MVYNVWLDVSAICVLLVILIAFHTKHSVPMIQNHVLYSMVILSIISTLMDWFSGIWYNDMEQLLIYLSRDTYVKALEAFSLIYFVTRNLVPVCYLIYILATLNIEKRSIKQMLPIAGPIIVSLVIIAVTPFTGAVFYVDSGGRYQRGGMLFVLYAIAFYYLLLSVYTVTYYRKMIPVQRRIAFYTFFAMTIITVAIQAKFQWMLVEGFGTAMCILLVYLTIQKPEEILDGATGFLNKKMFGTIMPVKLKQKSSFHVILIMIDDFDLLEKSYGMDVMDRLMREVSSYFRFFPKTLLFRMGEDKICLTVSEGSGEKVKNMLDDMIKRFSKPWNVSDLQVTLSTYFSCFQCPEDAGQLDDLLILMDAVSMSPRDEGKRKIDYHDIDISGRQRQFKIEGILKSAVEKGKLEVVYQPIYSIKKQRFVSAEALLRLRDEELGDISPAEFIPIAEKSGSIVKLGQFVLDEVCRLAASNHIRKYGIEYIEVNLSAIECLQDNLVENVMSHICRYGLAPGQINLEITETAASLLPEGVTEKLHKLVSQGVTFSMDDYGTGYSNLSRMIELPLEIIKIDKSIVQEAFTSESMKVVLDNTLQMVKMLNRHVLAEGVETLEQAQYFHEKGCDYIQGYFYSRPISAMQFLQKIREQSEAFI